MEVKETSATPVLFLIFNRPDVTRRVFEEIRMARPTRLYIAADGPRDGKSGEKQKCEEARSVVKLVDWPCEVRTLFRDSNLGCKRAVSSGITWFFDHEETGIILEDDCLPNQSFFRFCSELLVKYKDNPEVMHIGGCNFINHIFPIRESYYFTKYTHIWGWASWRRAWKHYDVDMKLLPQFHKERTVNKIFHSNGAKYYWLYRFFRVWAGKDDTWDYQWTFSVWKNGGKAISPGRNLVSNIGIESNTTHNLQSIEQLSNLPRAEMGGLVGPSSSDVLEQADLVSDKVVFRLTFVKKFLSFWLVQWLSSKKADQ